MRIGDDALEAGDDGAVVVVLVGEVVVDALVMCVEPVNSTYLVFVSSSQHSSDGAVIVCVGTNVFDGLVFWVPTREDNVGLVVLLTASRSLLPSGSDDNS